MAGTSLTRNIAAPPPRVWEVITDLESSPGLITAITAVERLGGPSGFGIGTRWRETRTVFGREATEVMEVTEFEDGRSYTVEADGKGAHYVSTFTVTAVGEGSVLTMTFDATPKGVVGRMLAATLGRMFAGSTSRALQQDLDDIAAAAEGLG